MNNYLNLINNN